MKYTEDFKIRVLAVVTDPLAKSAIISGVLDIGQYLEENAFKGIDSKIILECLYSSNLEYLEILAKSKEELKKLYNEYLEFYSEPKLQLYKDDKITLQ